MKNTTNPNTKLVAIAWDVHIVKGYREVIEVPVEISEEEMAKILDARYQAVNESLYTEDRDSRQRGNCSVDSVVMDGESPSIMVSRASEQLGGGLIFTAPDAAVQRVDWKLLAVNFAHLMCERLTPSQLQEANARNKTTGYAESTCATHDFCDANQVMLEALSATTGLPESDLNLNDLVDSTNRGWQAAKMADFDVNRLAILAAQDSLTAQFAASGNNGVGQLSEGLARLSGIAIGPQEELLQVQPEAKEEPELSNCGRYHILVEIPAMGPMEDLVECLQKAYDDGAAGNFKVLVTREPGWLVVFEREINPDEAGYLKDRLIEGAEDIELAAMAQLAAELESTATLVTGPVITDLRNGDAQIMDFDGVLASAGEYLQHSSQKG